MHRRWNRLILKIIFVICSLLWTAPGANLECAGSDTAFVTRRNLVLTPDDNPAGFLALFPDILPKGDHQIENGTSLELFCKLNRSHPQAKGFDARDLKFRGNQNGVRPNVMVLNDTTIKATIYGQAPGSAFYYCSLNNISCLTKVTVGYKPQPVLNFQCVSYNWEKLRCNWTAPPNEIKTHYNLTYTFDGRVGGIPRPCPNGSDYSNNTCTYDLETYPDYRPNRQYYYFNLLGKNELGEISMNYTFHNFAHMIPNKPENVTIVSKTVGSAVVGWFLPYPVFNFPSGITFKIEYKNKWEGWVEVDVPKNSKIVNKSHTFNITGLKYSHTAYDVRIYLKSAVAKVGPKDWSEPASVTFITPSTIPDGPPRTTQGSFEVVSSGNDTGVFVYWARVPEEYENGDDFTYDVVCTRDDGMDCGPPIEKAASFAEFPIDSLHSYTFAISSVNEVGRSVNSSYVFVPKHRSFIQPQSLTKVTYAQGVFELSWTPVHHPELSNYTIFWCKEEKDLPVPCKGYLDWLTVPKDTTSKNITMSEETKFHKFAIATNFVDGTSSGMMWSSCVISHDKALSKVNNFHISKIRAREVDVVWEIHCAQISTFRGFAIFYCPVDFLSQENKCKGNTTEEIVKVDTPESRNTTLTNLKPFTNYKLEISIISLDPSQKIQLGPRSNPQRFSTLDDAPTPPLRLTASTIQNTSVTLTWDLPEEMNGDLRTYILHVKHSGYLDKEFPFSARNITDNTIKNTYRIDNLVSYTTYNFTLKACTSMEKCSEYSKPAIVTTLIGAPGKMSKPQISTVNSSTASISWDPPTPPAGPLSYYQLLITVDGGSTENKLLNLTGSRVNLEMKACLNTSEFRIRAININENNISYFGPWSEATKFHCGSSDRVLIVWISGASTLFIVSACLFYIVKKGLLQCRKMKDVEVKLPSGLQSQDFEKENQDYVHLEGWPPRSTETVTGSVGTVLAPDEESLLDKKSDESMDITSFNMPIKNGGDSSGCSVGRESVSSSITSDTHISSDSGAEPDQCMIKPPAFELWNSSNPVRRNQPKGNVRNGGSKEGLNFPSLEEWDVSEPAIRGYTKVGYGTNGFGQEKGLPGKGYVTIASVASLNPSQKTNKSNGVAGGKFGEGPFTSETGGQQSGPKYVSLAHFEGQNGRDASNKSGGRSAPRELPKLSRLDESSERDDSKTEDSTEDDFSGKETDTETIHEVPIGRDLTPMPPYVTMTENPGRSPGVPDSEDEEEEEDEETEKEDSRLSPEPKESESKANGIEGIEKTNKENESFSNYIPHHLFGKESVNT